MADAVSRANAFRVLYLTTYSMKFATTPTTTLMSTVTSIGGYQFYVWKLAKLSSRAWHDVWGGFVSSVLVLCARVQQQAGGSAATVYRTVSSIAAQVPLLRGAFVPSDLCNPKNMKYEIYHALLPWWLNTAVYRYMYMVITHSRVWINRVRLPIMLVVSRTGKMNNSLSPCKPKYLISRDGYGNPVPRQPAHLHTQAESGAYLRDSSRVPRRRPFMKPPYAIGSVPSLSGHAIAYRWRSLPRVRQHRVSKPQGSSERVLPWQVTINQLIFASLSHTHYWYKVGMLSKMYQSSRLPSKKYRALPWGLSTTVAYTRVVDYNPKNAVHYRGAEYHGSMYQSGRLPSKQYRALPWRLNTAVNTTNLKNRCREEPWSVRGHSIVTWRDIACRVTAIAESLLVIAQCCRISTCV